MAEGAERIPLTETRRALLTNKLEEYGQRMGIDVIHTAPEVRGKSYTWYGYFMIWCVLENGYFDVDELRERVVTNLGSHFVEDFFDERAGVIKDYLLNNGAYTYKVPRT